MRASMRIAGLAWVTACGPAATRSETVAPPPATAQTCERLADHLVRLLKTDLAASGLATTVAQSRRAPLLRECLDRGDAVTANCLLSARSLQETARCRGLDPAREPPPLADHERATPQECARFAAHTVELLRAQLEDGGLDPGAADEATGDIEAMCLAEASRTEVRCGLAARTADELEAC